MHEWIPSAKIMCRFGERWMSNVSGSGKTLGSRLAAFSDATTPCPGHSA